MAAARKKRKDKKSSINKQTTSDVKEEPEGKELHCDHVSLSLEYFFVLLNPFGISFYSVAGKRADSYFHGTNGAE